MASQDLTLLSSLSMTSTEISELTAKAHSNVLRDIRAMLVQVHDLKDDSDLNHQSIQGVVIERDARNYISQIRLDKDHTLTLLTGYDAKARFKVMRRWQELEAEAAQPALNPANLTRLQLIEMAMQSEQERLALESKVAVIQPKADALDRIATASDGSMCPTNAAKALQMRRTDLIAWMLVHQWVYRRAGNKNLIAYQDKIHQGLLEHKIHVSRDETGVERVHENVLVTPKGLAKLARIFQVTLQAETEGEAA